MTTNYGYHYHSEHLDKDNQKLRIYHLMFDFNEIMPSKAIHICNSLQTTLNAKIAKE